jgi:hypothetical protein
MFLSISDVKTSEIAYIKAGSIFARQVEEDDCA